MERLQNIPITEPVIIVATGKYVGEGFDYPRLDTMFLTIPVSWKGIIAQYAGRLHRDFPNKKEVRIYDYIDIRVPMCNTMYKRRLKGYASVGYQIRTNTLSDLFNENASAIFNSRSYQEAFYKDLLKAKHSIIISTTKPVIYRYTHILDVLKKLISRGIKIKIFVKNHPEKVESFEEIGIKIAIKSSLTLHTAIIDKSLIWYGSIDFLGYNTEEENTIRITDTALAKDLIEALCT